MTSCAEPALDELERRRRWVREKRPNTTLTTTGELARKTRPAGSRALHRVGDLSAHSAAGLSAGISASGWFVVGLFTGFPSWWQTVLYSVSSSITLVMVFAIQHTQSRQQSAVQRKLDELLRTQPAADGRLIAAEHGPEGELDALATLNVADRNRVSDGKPGR